MPNPFSPANTAKAVHDSLAQATAAIPPGHKRALLLHATVEGGSPTVRAVLVQRAPDGWNVLLEGAYSGTDGPSAGVAVSRSWK